MIVLGYEVAQRDIRAFSVGLEDVPFPLRVVETEVVVHPVKVFKGAPLSSEIKFRFVDGRSPGIIGPPQGPSGGPGFRGIFFLRRESQGSLRSVVDYYRPDIETPWLEEPAFDGPCGSTADCIANFLLTFDASHKARSFAGHLPVNTAKSMQLTGFLNTLGLLSALVGDVNPPVIRHAACAELIGWYALEAPAACGSPFQGESTGFDQQARVASLRKALSEGGIAWVAHRIGTSDRGEVARYLELLKRSPHPDTRVLAENLARGFR